MLAGLPAAADTVIQTLRTALRISPAGIRAETVTALVPANLVPDVIHRAQSRPGISCGGLHENVLPVAAAFQKLHQHYIQEQAASQA